MNKNVYKKDVKVTIFFIKCFILRTNNLFCYLHRSLIQVCSNFRNNETDYKAYWMSGKSVLKKKQQRKQQWKRGGAYWKLKDKLVHFDIKSSVVALWDKMSDMK